MMKDRFPCHRCNTLLGLYALDMSKIPSDQFFEIKCSKCNAINRLSGHANDVRLGQDAKLIVATAFSVESGLPLHILLDMGSPTTMQFVANLALAIDKRQSTAVGSEVR